MPNSSSRAARGWPVAVIAATMCLGCMPKLVPWDQHPEPAALEPPTLALGPGPCLIAAGQVECDHPHSAAHGERDVVDIQRTEDIQCVLYANRRLLCSLEGFRRYAFEHVDQFALEPHRLCTLERGTGATCNWKFGVGSGYTADHPRFADAEQIALSGSLGLCGVFAGSELRCVPPWYPAGDPHVVPDVVEIASEGALTCLRKVDGTVWCWDEALGGPEFDDDDPQPPTQVSGLPSTVEIDVGRAHACARDHDGGVWCWGQGEEGQLGQGLPVGASLVAVPVWPQVEVSALWIEGDHSCGLEVGSDTPSGLRCWGLLPSWKTSLSVGTADDAGPERMPELVEPRCVELDLQRWVADFPRVNTDLDFTHHLALLGLARYDAELFWTQALERSVEVRTLELDGEAPPELLIVAQVRDPYQRHVFIRALFADQERWCINAHSLIHLEFGPDDALGGRASELLDEAGRPVPDPVVIEPIELFGDGGQALLIHALAGRDQVSQTIWLWHNGLARVSPKFFSFRFDYNTGANHGELLPSTEQPGQVRVREWSDCTVLRHGRDCRAQRWEALWQFEHGSFVETQRHHWLDPSSR